MLGGFVEHDSLVVDPKTPVGVLGVRLFDSNLEAVVEELLEGSNWPSDHSACFLGLQISNQSETKDVEVVHGPDVARLADRRSPEIFGVRLALILKGQRRCL